MRLKANIKGKEYDVVQGATFTEQLNETLDSGSLIIETEERIDNLKPYDDVLVHESGYPFKGYPIANEASNGENEDLGALCYALRVGTPELGYSPWRLSFPMKTVGEVLSSVQLQLRFASDSTSRDLVFSLKSKSRGETNKATFSLSWVDNSTGKATDTGFETSIEWRDGSVEIGNVLSTYLTGFQAFIGTLKTALRIGKVIAGDAVHKGFYRHMLVDQYSEERVGITSGWWKYRIQLFSETKKLEKIQMPNVTVTQPISGPFLSCWEVLSHWVGRYSPEVRVAITDKTWAYVKRYRLDESLKERLESIPAPETQLNAPSLRAAISAIMIAADLTPKVEDDVIGALDLAKEGGDADVPDDGIVSKSWSMSSDNYADSLVRRYSNAISNEGTARIVEGIGFRNSSLGSAMLTLSNMRVETRFPIYKVNRILMRYKRKAWVVSNNYPSTPLKELWFECKHDITACVKQNAQRNLLSQDWENFKAERPSTLGELAEYKIGTVGYSIGSKTIEGWGESYSWPLGWWRGNETKTVIEAIFKVADDADPTGIYQGGLESVYPYLKEGESLRFPKDESNPMSVIYSPYSQALKAFTFEIEYEAMPSPATVVEKEGAVGDIQSSDSQGSSLTILQTDGSFQQSKANRIGNKALALSMRADSPDGLPSLGERIDGAVIYSKTTSIYANEVKASLQATENYVLRDYFVSVNSRLRPFALATYGESVSRKESIVNHWTLSKSELTNGGTRFDGPTFFELMSFVKDTEAPSVVGGDNSSSLIDSAKFGDYATDVACFAYGTSLCVDFDMFDNVSGGVYVADAQPAGGTYDPNTSGDIVGAIQKWYMESDGDGRIGSVRCSFGHSSDEVEFLPSEDVGEYQDADLALPKKSEALPYGSEEEFHKDNKETLGVTYQTTMESDDSGVVLTHEAMRLSDLAYGGVRSESARTLVSYGEGFGEIVMRMTAVGESVGTPSANALPYLAITMEQSVLDAIAGRDMMVPLTFSFVEYPGSTSASLIHWGGNSMSVRYDSSDPNELWISFDQTASVRKSDGTVERANERVRYKLIKTSSLLGVSVGGVSFTNLTVEKNSSGFVRSHEFSQAITVGGIEQTRFSTCIVKAPVGPTFLNNLNRVSISDFVKYSSNFVASLETYDVPQSLYVYASSGKASEERSSVRDIEWLRSSLVPNENDDRANTYRREAKVSDFISVYDHRIQVDPTGIPAEAKSIQVWHLDGEGKARMMLGIDLSEPRIPFTIYASESRRKGKDVMDANMNVVGRLRDVKDDFDEYAFRLYDKVI